MVKGFSRPFPTVFIPNAVEEYGEGKQHGEIMHGGEHTLAGREEVPRR